MAIAIGLIAGVLLAFLFEQLDDTVKSSEDVESRVRAPVLGIIPMVSAKEMRIAGGDVALLAATDPKSPLAEAVRSLRTSLLFATTDGAPKIMHLTSAVPGEGKSTAAASIAITFAQAGSKVLLIDGDLRSPSLHRMFGLANARGLTNYLAGDTKPAEIAQPTQVTRLYAITSGPLPPNPVELLSSAKMLDLLNLSTERFDYVVLDGPPVIGLADALVLANLARGTLFVVDAGRTRFGAIEGAVKRLRAANTPILGAVIDRLGRAGGGYGYGYSYDYHYTYSYGSRDEGRALPERV
jgi:capsular exopolysaccharide synthesis family protein